MGLLKIFKKDANDVGDGEGFSLLELLIASSILAIMILGLLSVMLNSRKLDRITKEKSVAINTLKYVAAFFEANVSDNDKLEDFVDIYYNTNKGFEGLTGKSEEISVSDLEKQGLNNIRYTHTSNNKPVLVECYPLENSNNPLQNADLDGNSNTAIDTITAYKDTLASGNPRILPVKLTIEWKSARGEKNYSKYIVHFVLGGK